MKALPTSLLLLCIPALLAGCGASPEASPAEAPATAPAPLAVSQPATPEPASAPAPAAPPTQDCQYSGSTGSFAYSPAIEKACWDAGTPLETCASFAVTFRDGKRVDDQALGIESQDGALAFQPAGISAFEEEVGGDVWARVELYLIAPGGGNAAEERWVVFDDAGGQVSPLMDYAQRTAWKAARHQPNEALFLSDPVSLTATCTGD